MITTDIFFTIMVLLLGVWIGRKSGDWMKTETDPKPRKTREIR